MNAILAIIIGAAFASWWLMVMVVTMHGFTSYKEEFLDPVRPIFQPVVFILTLPGFLIGTVLRLIAVIIAFIFLKD